jgi:hypothetical protein
VHPTTFILYLGDSTAIEGSGRTECTTRHYQVA